MIGKAVGSESDASDTYFFKKSSVTLAEMSSNGLPRPNTSPSLEMIRVKVDEVGCRWS